MHQAQPDPLVRKALMDQPDRRAFKASRASKVMLGQLDLPALKEIPAPPVLREMLVRLARLAQLALRATSAQQDPLDQPEPPGLLERLAPRDQPVLPAQRGRPDRLDLRARKGRQDLPDRPDQLDLPDPRVPKAFRVT